MSSRPVSNMIHREDGGSVFSSIRNDGTIIHWCDKCNAVWISEEKPEAQITQVKGIEVEKRYIAALKIKKMDIEEIVSELKEKFVAKQSTASQ